MCGADLVKSVKSIPSESDLVKSVKKSSPSYDFQVLDIPGMIFFLGMFYNVYWIRKPDETISIQKDTFSTRWEFVVTPSNDIDIAKSSRLRVKILRKVRPTMSQAPQRALLSPFLISRTRSSCRIVWLIWSALLVLGGNERIPFIGNKDETWVHPESCGKQWQNNNHGSLRCLWSFVFHQVDASWNPCQ